MIRGGPATAGPGAREDGSGPSLRRSFHLRELHVRLGWSAAVGVIGAVSSMLFRDVIRLGQWALVGEAKGFVHTALMLPWWARALVPTLGGLVAGAILEHGPRIVPGAAPDYMEAISVGDGAIPARPALLKSLASLASISSGASIGREGAMVQLSATWASVLGRAFRLSTPRLRLVVACGAAAGIAAAYNAPIAGALFVAEIVFGSIAMESFGALVVSSVLASLVMRTAFSARPIFEVPAFHMTSPVELVAHLGLGVVAGFAGPAFLLLLRVSRRGLGRLLPRPTLRMTAGGALVGLVSVAVPQVWGNGYSVVTSMLNGQWLFGAVAVVLVAKLAATVATVGSGAVGGVFTPTLFTGAALGMLVGLPLHALFPETVAAPQAYAIVGMGAFLAATTHAPLMAMIMIFEMTLDYAIALPLMLACVAAYYVATLVYPDSIYSSSLRHPPSPRPGRATGEAERPGEAAVPAGALEGANESTPPGGVPALGRASGEAAGSP